MCRSAARRRALSTLREPLGLTARRTPLHVDDLAVAHCEHHEPLLMAVIRRSPRGRPDDLVTYLRELGRDSGQMRTLLLQLELQDLTGVVGTASTRRLLPPQMAVGDSAPFAVLVDKRKKRLRVSAVERIFET